VARLGSSTKAAFLSLSLKYPPDTNGTGQETDSARADE
jgi:hypothetical protein